MRIINIQTFKVYEQKNLLKVKEDVFYSWSCDHYWTSDLLIKFLY